MVNAYKWHWRSQSLHFYAILQFKQRVSPCRITQNGITFCDDKHDADLINLVFQNRFQQSAFSDSSDWSGQVRNHWDLRDCGYALERYVDFLVEHLSDR